MKTRIAGHSRRKILGVVGAAVLLGGLPFAAPVVPAQDAKPKIGLIGSGNVGGALGRSWVRAGYDVMFSSRNLDDNRALAAEIGAGVQSHSRPSASNSASIRTGVGAAIFRSRGRAPSKRASVSSTSARVRGPM